MPARCSLRSAALAERKKLRSPRGLAMWSGRPSIQPRMSASRPANKSGGAMPSSPAIASARRSRANRWRATPKLHHGTSSIRRHTASTSPARVPKRPRPTVESRSRLSTTPLVQRSSISRGKPIVLFRGRGAIGAGDPALEVGEGAASERALFCQHLFRAAQALSAFALDRVRERRKEAEIDVHRLGPARGGRFCGADGFHMAAGGIGGGRAQRPGRAGPGEVRAEPFGGREAARDEPDGGGFHVALAAGDLTGKAQARLGIEPQNAIEELGRVQEGVAVKAAEARELGPLETRDGAEDAR